MLRAVVLGLGALLVLTGALGIILGLGPEMLGPFILGAVLLIGTVFEPHYKKNLRPSANEGFSPTGERFFDPTQGGAIEVWYNKASGERRYIAVDSKNQTLGA